ALLPLTVVPAFMVAPMFEDVGAVIWAASRLLVLIGAAATLAFAIRGFWLKELAPRQGAAIDGASALALVALLFGLMSAAGPALRETPGLFALHLAAACVANFGMQIVAALCFRRLGWRRTAPALAISVGNRNIAIFLAAL